MQVVKLKDEAIDFHVKIVISNQEIEKEINKELLQLQPKVTISGFRPGKVPIQMISSRYGDSIRTEVVQKKIEQSLKDVIKDNKLNVATPPKVDTIQNQPDQDLECTIKFELLPKITMPEFNKISIEKPVLNISEDDIKSEIKTLAEMSTTYEKENKGKAKNKDMLTIDAVGTIDGIEFEGGNLKNHKLVLGSKRFIDNFEDQLIGSKKGDEVIVKVKFPKDYHAKDLAGKKAEFVVKVLDIHEGTTPAIDDEFAKKFKVNSIKELENNIKNNISKFHNREIHTIMKMHLFDKLEGLLTFEVPESLYEKEYNNLQNQTKEFLEEDTDLKNKDKKELAEYFKSLAMRRVRIGLMLSECAKNKEFKITENDLKAAIFDEARQFPGKEQRIVDFYMKNPNAIEQIKGLIIEEKAVQYIFDHEVQITEKSYTKKELEELIKSQSEKVAKF